MLVILISLFWQNTKVKFSDNFIDCTGRALRIFYICFWNTGWYWFTIISICKTSYLLAISTTYKNHTHSMKELKNSIIVITKMYIIKCDNWIELELENFIFFDMCFVRKWRLKFQVSKYHLRWNAENMTLRNSFYF